MRDKSNLLLVSLRELLGHEAVHTQEDIKLALSRLGIEANQSKISRALHKIGAVKTKNASGQVVYQLPKEPAPPTTSSSLANLLIDIVHNEIMIIVHTSPGSASLIARVLDHHAQQLNILGTVAGDDTIVVIPTSIKETQKTLNALKTMLMNLK